MNFVTAEIFKKITFHKNVMWFVIGIIFVITTSVAIAETKWLYLGILATPLLLYFIIKYPFIFPFGLYVLLVPLDRILDFAGFSKGSTVTKLLGILTILVLSVKGSLEKKFIKPSSVSIIFMLFVMYCFMTILWAINPGYVSSGIKTIVSLFVFYMIASAYKINEREYNTLIWCILFGGILTAILTIYTYEMGFTYGRTERATITFMEQSINPNFLSLGLLFPLSICIQMILNKGKKIHKIFFICIFFLILYSIILTGSRKSFIGVGIILAFYNAHIKKKLTFGTIAFTSIIVLLAIAPGYFMGHIESSLYDRGAGRLDIWQVGVKALQKYWLLGAGLSNFRFAFDEFVNEGTYFVGFSRDAHNTYLKILVETGMMGLILLFWVLKKHYKLLKPRLIHYDINFVMLKASFWSILVCGLFGDLLLEKSFWLLFMMIVMYRNVLMTDIRPFIFKRDAR